MKDGGKDSVPLFVERGGGSAAAFERLGIEGGELMVDELVALGD